ncbi:hypothetical protein [Haloarcula rubripromontorii]|uniref:hypothetical protein n=1 Tax=Haloarcula rubripromontorii TaxID=1705562 RepID=UPI00345C38EA
MSVQYCTTNCPVGTTLNLQSDLKDSEIHQVGSDVVEFKHRTSVEQSDWEHRYEKDTHGGHVCVDLPENCVIIDFDGNGVHYMEKADD